MNSIATTSLMSGQLPAIERLQTKLAQVTTEISSGKVADVGLALGSRVSNLLDKQSEVSELGAYQQTNGVVLGRLQTLDSALSSMAGIADSLSQAAITAIGSSLDVGKKSLIDAAKTGLSQLTSLIGTTYNGQYVFGGINSDHMPVQDYLSETPGAGRTSVQSSFAATFGFPPDDAKAQSITADAMKNYLTGDFATNFQESSWTTKFSSASTDPITYDAAPKLKIEEDVSANSAGIVKLYAALTAVVDSGTANLNSDAFGALASFVASMAGSASSQLGLSQSSNGLTEKEIGAANAAMSQQQTNLNADIDKMTGVDPAEASIQFTQMSMQLQATYADTARLQQFSILNYLPT